MKAAWEDTSGPEVGDLREMLAHPDQTHFYARPSDRHSRYVCEYCGTKRAEWWVLLNGERLCCVCVGRDTRDVGAD